jgi:hypothetical protein
VIILRKLLALFIVGEAIVPPKLRTTPDGNRSKRKHDEKTIYRPQGIQGIT